jgi:hypothetical protein
LHIPIHCDIFGRMERPKPIPLELGLKNKAEEIAVKSQPFEVARKELADSIREYSILQFSLWNKIANLALEAKRSRGYCDIDMFYNNAKSEYLSLDINRPNGIGEETYFHRIDGHPAILSVYLATGEIVNSHWDGYGRASDLDVSGLLYRLDRLNARIYVEALKVQAKRTNLTIEEKEEIKSIRQLKGWPELTQNDLKPGKLSSQESFLVEKLLSNF